MEKSKQPSNRLLSLSSISGIVVGVIGLFGCYIAFRILYVGTHEEQNIKSLAIGYNGYSWFLHNLIGEKLFFTAAYTFLISIAFSFFINYSKNKRNKIKRWDVSVEKQLLKLFLSIIVGIVIIAKLLVLSTYVLICPIALITYGLGLVLASDEDSPYLVYLGNAEIILGILNLWIPYKDIYFLAAGFGLFHILFGLFTLFKLDKLLVSKLFDAEKHVS
jgi:hypothetical protein